MLHHHQKSTSRTFRAKEFRHLYHEYQKLWRQRFDAPKVKLEHPFQRGYERFFVLTDQAKKRSDVDDLTIVLEFFRSYQYCRKGQFRTGKPQGKRWTKGETGEHLVQRPYLYSLLKKGFPERFAPYLKSSHLNFSKNPPSFNHLSHSQQWQRISFRYQKLLKSHTQPHIVTHLPLHDPDLEARLNELDTLLWQSHRQGEVQKALHLRRYYYQDRPLWKQMIREDAKQHLEELNSDPSIKSAVSPRFFVFWLG